MEVEVEATDWKAEDPLDMGLLYTCDICRKVDMQVPIIFRKNEYNTKDIRLGIVSCRAITTFKVGSHHRVVADRNHETCDSKYLQLTLKFELIVLRLRSAMTTTIEDVVQWYLLIP